MSASPSQQQINTLVSLYNRGELEAVIARANALVEQFPTAIILHNILGAAYSNGGRKEDALTCFAKAVEINPSYPDAHNNLGATLRNLGRPKDAIQSYENALNLKPDYAEAHYNLGNALNDLGRQDEAAASFSRALELKPSYFDAHNNLGLALNSLGRHEEALASFLNAVELDPINPNALNNLGVTFRALGRQEEAIKQYGKALKIKPDHDEAHYNLANALNDLGHRERALASYATALQINPKLAEAYRSMGSIKLYETGDPQISQMQKMLKESSTSETDKMHLNFALGKAHEDLENFEKAFEYYGSGNFLRKKAFGFDLSEERKLFDTIIKTFNSEPSLPKSDAACADGNKHTPIFIVGMMRSGTSLVEQILASHSEVYGAGELLALGQGIQSVNWSGTSIDRRQLDAVKQSYMQHLSTLGAREPFVTDKAPLNFRWIGFVRHALPNAKIIHVKRDPVATCWSIYKHYFSSIGNGYAYDMRDVADYYNLYLRLMMFWKKKYQDAIYEISYEQLTENQEDETRKLLAHIGLRWERRTLDFHETKRAVATVSAAQVREKMYKGSSEEWRKYEPFIQPMVSILRQKS